MERVKTRVTSGFILLCLFASLLLVNGPTAAYALPSAVAVKADDPRPGATASYVGWSWAHYQTATPVKCISITISSGPGGTGGLPTGSGIDGYYFDSSGLTGTWTPDGTNAASGSMVVNNSAGYTPPNDYYQFFGFDVNQPTAPAGTAVYVTVATYGNAGSGYSGACGSSILDGPTTALFQTVPSLTVSTNVSQQLTFAVSAHVGSCNGAAQTTGTTATPSSISLGSLSAGLQTTAAQDLSVNTNAANGFTVYTRDTGALSDGQGHSIPDLSGATNSAPTAFATAGTAAFAYTTDDASLGTGTTNRFTNSGPKWAAMTTSDSEVFYEPTVAQSSTCVAFRAGSSATIPAGAFSTKIIYTAVPRF